MYLGFISNISRRVTAMRSARMRIGQDTRPSVGRDRGDRRGGRERRNSRRRRRMAMMAMMMGRTMSLKVGQRMVELGRRMRKVAVAR